MPKERRKKGCVNVECECHKKKRLFAFKNNFCPICGERLEIVCIKCGEPIGDKDSDQTMCDNCTDAQYRIEKFATSTMKKASAAKGSVSVIAKKGGSEIKSGVVKVVDNPKVKEAISSVGEKVISEAEKIAKNRVGEIAKVADQKTKIKQKKQK